MKKLPKISNHDAANLFELRVKGMLARMFDERGVQPTTDEWAMIQGDFEISLTDIAHVCYKLGYQPEIGFKDRMEYDIYELDEPL